MLPFFAARLLACTASEDDSADEFVFDRDMIAEECSPATGIVGVGSEWVYQAAAELSAAGGELDETVRVTNVDAREIEVQSLRTLTDAATSGDTGDTSADPTGTIDHYTWTFSCETDGLYLSAEGLAHYASLSMSGGPDLTGTRRYDPAVRVLPFSLDDTPAWEENYAGTSDYPGDDASFAYARSCTAATPTTVEFAVGPLTAYVVTCASSDGAHDETYWQVNALGRARDALREVVAYAP